MVKSKKLVEEYRRQIGRFSYDELDCIHSIANIIHRYGGKSQLTGSNWWARHEIKNLRPLTSRSQLYDGCAVLKTVHPGESGYALPTRYKNHAVQIDYNHIGLGTDQGEILDSTRYGKQPDGSWTRNGPGVSTAPINSRSWDVIGDFEDVDYSDRGTTTPEQPIEGNNERKEPDTVMREALVTAPDGGTVNLRARPTLKEKLVREYVPSGTVIEAGEDVNGWSRVRTPSGKSGWMMSEFLKRPDSEDVPFLPDEPIPDVPPGDAAQALEAAKAHLQKVFDYIEQAKAAL